MKRYYKFPIERMDDHDVEQYYAHLQVEVENAFKTDWARVCAAWECWDGVRCRNFCEVARPCIRMCKEHRENWPGGNPRQWLAEKGFMI